MRFFKKLWETHKEAWRSMFNKENLVIGLIVITGFVVFNILTSGQSLSELENEGYDRKFWIYLYALISVGIGTVIIIMLSAGYQAIKEKIK